MQIITDFADTPQLPVQFEKVMEVMIPYASAALVDGASVFSFYFNFSNLV